MKDYENNGYPKPKPTEDKITGYRGVRPAEKKGPQPTDIGTTSGKEQARKYYKGNE